MIEYVPIEFRGNVYISLPGWRIKVAPFVVIKLIDWDDIYGSVATFQIKTIGRHSTLARVSSHGIRKCKKVNIEELVKALLLGDQP